jgi:hypothetical protein
MGAVLEKVPSSQRLANIIFMCAPPYLVQRYALIQATPIDRSGPQIHNEVMAASQTRNEVMAASQTLNEVMEASQTLNEVMATFPKRVGAALL